MALLQTLQRSNPKSKLSVAPVQADGTWALQLSYEGEEPKRAPTLWHGHRVVLHRVEPPPPRA